MTFISFPSIGQFRHAIENVKQRAQYDGKDSNGDPIYNETKKLPTLKYKGTIKLHGTNGGIVRDASGNMHAQSRKNILNPPSTDNNGFGMFFKKNEAEISSLFDKVMPNDEISAIYGEWCGKGIQKNVAISQLDKMFIIFGAIIYTPPQGEDFGNRKWITLDVNDIKPLNSIGIYHVDQFPTFEIKVDFSNPIIAAKKLQEYVTKVENECPVGAYFDVKGIGEGLVWKCITEGWETSGMWFKTKGEKHSISTPKNKKERIPISPEKLATISDFIEYAVTENRMEQGYQELISENGNFTNKHIGKFIGWVVKDILKEESDVMIKSELSKKDVNGSIANKAREWILARLNANAGL